MPPVTDHLQRPIHRPVRYSWSRFNDGREWRCKETGEVVTDIQIANVDYTYDISHIPESFHGVLRSLLSGEARKRFLKQNWEQKRARRGCRHPEDKKDDITEFGDSYTRYLCRVCGYEDPKPKRKTPPTDIEKLTAFFAECDEVILRWKKEAIAHKIFMKEVDDLIEEVLNAKSK